MQTKLGFNHPKLLTVTILTNKCLKKLEIEKGPNQNKNSFPKSKILTIFKNYSKNQSYSMC